MSGKLTFAKITIEEALEFIAKGMTEFLYAREKGMRIGRIERDVSGTLYSTNDTDINISIHSIDRYDWYVLEPEEDDDSLHQFFMNHSQGVSWSKKNSREDSKISM